MYQFYVGVDDETIIGVRRLSDGACIPIAHENSDYQEFLRWQDEGGVALQPGQSPDD